MSRESLEEVISRLSREWRLEIGPQFPLATCSEIFACYRAGRECVLKIPHPTSEERQSLPVLLAFAEVGGVVVQEVDVETGAILMPLLGIDLASSSLAEEDRVRACAALIRDLHEAEIETSVYRLSDEFREPTSVLPVELAEASHLAEWLLGTTKEEVVLHGDLHHFNILRDGSRWRAIDPKGVVGDPAFEPCAYLRNPVGKLPPMGALPSLMRTRLLVFAEELPYPIERMWAWAYVQTTWCAFDCTASAKEDWQGVSDALWELRAEFGP